MPSIQQGAPYRLGAGRWGVRYRDRSGARRRKSPFPTKHAALRHYREVIEPQLRGEHQSADLTLTELVDVYLEQHAARVRARTIVVLRERLGYAIRAFGDVKLHNLERMSGDIAMWQASLPEGSRYGVTQALRQALAAAVRWEYMTSNPAMRAGPNRQPAPRPIRTFARTEVDALAARIGPLPAFVAATGLRPEEWMALERRDVDRRARVLDVRRTVTDGEVSDLAKTD